MEPSSFTIEFPEHVPYGKRQYCLDCLADDGGLVESQGDRTVQITCLKRSQWATRGWSLFHMHFSNLCRVIAASGAAEARATAYSKPPCRDEGSVSDLDPPPLRHVRLSLVNRPESFSLEFQRAGYMQSVEGSHAELRAMAAAEVCANIEGVFRYCCLKPQAICPVALQRGEDGIRFSLGNLFIKHLFGDGMETFRRVKRCKPEAGFLFHPLSRGCRMHILQVERREKTGIGVDSQKRPRSFIKSSTTFKTR